MSDEKSVKIYQVKGYLRTKNKSKFVKEFCAISEKDVEEKIFTEFGSKNRIKRNLIKITRIKEISKDEITDKNLLAMMNSENIRIPFGG